MRRWVEAWNGGDFDGFFDLYDVDAEVITDPAWMEAGPFTGRPAIRAWFKGLEESWDGNTVDLKEVFEARDEVVVRFVWRVRGRSSGLETELEATSVNAIDAGRIVRQQYYFDHGEALDAVWLSP